MPLAADSPQTQPTVPRQLPADVPAFFRRASELADLNDLLGTDSTAHFCVVAGTAGVGKPDTEL